MENKRQRRKYLLTDFLMSVVAWALFYFYRRYFIDAAVFEKVSSPLSEVKFYWELIVIPLYWLFIFYLSGYYERLNSKSRIVEFFQTISAVFVGALLLFFIVVLNDAVHTYKHYYLILLVLVVLEFTLVYAFRLWITYCYHRDLSTGKKGFRTLIIADSAEGVMQASEIPAYMGHRFVGVVMRDRLVGAELTNGFQSLGTYDDLDEVLTQYAVEDVVLGLKNAELSEIQRILTILYRRNVRIKLIPEVYEKLIGSAKLQPLYGCNMMEVSHELMSPFQMRIKRLMDVSIASVVMVLLLPVYLYVTLRIVLDSKGSPIYKQERIGKNGKPFMMYKFRSMVVSAEKDTPQLTKPDDERITNYGRYIRKYRIDELPQFWNVLKGDMSLVGPRPERQFFIDRMVASAPDYFFLQKVRPGITSLGMVKFGYADTVEKMLKRFKYDLIYVENMSLMLDLKVLYYTFFVILTGKGV